jgi:hypothetical protein
VYYYFSTQFRENLEAHSLYPNDDLLRRLDHSKRYSGSLFAWPGVAKVGERRNHDEFKRRTLERRTIAEDRRRGLEGLVLFVFLQKFARWMGSRTQ